MLAYAPCKRYNEHMRYVALTMVIFVIGSSVWVVNDRADSSAKEIISTCNDRYEKDIRTNQSHHLDNSENVRDKERCVAEAHQSASSDKSWGIATIVVSSIISFTLYLARRKTST